MQNDVNMKTLKEQIIEIVKKTGGILQSVIIEPKFEFYIKFNFFNKSISISRYKNSPFIQIHKKTYLSKKHYEKYSELSDDLKVEFKRTIIKKMAESNLEFQFAFTKGFFLIAEKYFLTNKPLPINTLYEKIRKVVNCQISISIILHEFLKIGDDKFNPITLD